MNIFHINAVYEYVLQCHDLKQDICILETEIIQKPVETIEKPIDVCGIDKKEIVVLSTESNQFLEEPISDCIKRNCPEYHVLWKKKSDKKKCLVATFKLSRINHNVDSVLKDLELTGKRILVVIVHFHDENNPPPSFSNIQLKREEIDGYVNMLYYNNSCYDCDTNQSAIDEILKFIDNP
ncbi:uncharacterized protein LOC133201630 [Saccostrea echinata]|uniref:uncharacterized protein LOC133201630 n=1 Tax=Saccostrea echinata TaxID=191078 RepID=UPI002A80E586|nr:uncharacterized protein LOC133201630 [Saccostrea echinata]